MNQETKERLDSLIAKAVRNSWTFDTKFVRDNITMTAFYEKERGNYLIKDGTISFIHTELKKQLAGLGEDDIFGTEVPGNERKVLEDKIELLELIAKERVFYRENAKKAAETKKRKKLIEQILEKKKLENLENMSEEELQRLIEE